MFNVNGNNVYPGFVAALSVVSMSSTKSHVVTELEIWTSVLFFFLVEHIRVTFQVFSRAGNRFSVCCERYFDQQLDTTGVSSSKSSIYCIFIMT